MFKLGTIGAILKSKNNPRVQCANDVKNGYAFKVVDGGVNYAEEATAFASDAEAQKGDVYVAINIVDTPELLNSTDFVVKAGEKIRAFRLDDLVGLPLEMSSDLVTTAYADVAVGDILVPSTDLKWKEQPITSTYDIALKVLEKTTFGGTGFYCKVIKDSVKA